MQHPDQAQPRVPALSRSGDHRVDIVGNDQPGLFMACS